MPESLLPLEIPDYISPEIAAGPRVTVRYFQPNARSVWTQAEWDDWRPKAMARDPAGLWSVTSPRLAPDIYEYAIFADGMPAADGKNPWGRHAFAPLVEVPGAESAAHDPGTVSHGSTHAHWYDSTATGEFRRLHVYTPPGYETGTEKYPVLYLLHGAGDDDSTWIGTGRMNWLLDNLIAQGRAVPVIVVMPLGHVRGRLWKEHRAEKLALFTADLHEFVLPLIERLYRVRPGAGNRAMAGLSMGGGQTICAGLARPDLFRAIGIFSAGVWPEVAPVLEAALPAIRTSAPSPLWVGIGRRDFLYPRCTLLREALAGIPFTYHEDDFGHTWRAWRRYLLQFVPLLFRGP